MLMEALLGFFGAGFALMSVWIVKLIAEVRLWREDARDMRDAWRWEREQTEFLRDRTEHLMELLRKPPQDGPFR